jgi:hypothetical protein
MFNFLIQFARGQFARGQSARGQSARGHSARGQWIKALTRASAAGVIFAIAQPSQGIATPSQSAFQPAQLTESAATNRQVVSRRPSRPRPPRRLPPNQVQPGGGLDVAARSCDSNSSALTALIPVENPVYTASAYPTFLFYLPDAPEQVAYAEFILLGPDEKEEIYSAQFVPTRSGVVSISLPEQPAYALEADQAYHWYFNLHCKMAKVDGESPPAVNGWVQRLTESEPAEGLADSSEGLAEGLADGSADSPSETAVPEVVPEVWYDAIAQVAETLAANPTTESRQLWESWLSAVGLGEIADEPVVGSVF